MGACDSTGWNMNVILDRDPTVIARPFFRNVTITNGEIKGDVEDPLGTNISDLGGACGPFKTGGVPDMAVISFVFRLKDVGSEIGIFMTGFAFIGTSGKAEFRGRWIAFPPGAGTPSAGSASLFLPAEGDTGTGTGQQT